MSQLNELQAMNNQVSDALQNCNQIGYKSYYPYWNERVVYVPEKADVAIHKAENGFKVEIKGKSYIAKCSAEIAVLIDAHLK